MNTREAVQKMNIRHSTMLLNTHGTKLVWNSLRSTFKDPSKRRDAVIEETTWAINLLRLVKPGEVILSLFLQIS